MEQREIYPLTIIKDRYNGTYSGGKFLAINNFHNEIDESIGGSDPEEMIFWNEFKQGENNGFLGVKLYIGKGKTINDAYLDLYKLIDSEIK